MSRSSDWRDLESLTGLAFEAAQQKMVSLRNRETQIRETLAAILRSGPEQSGSSDHDLPALRAGAETLWQQWVDRRRSDLNLELARTLVQIDAARTALSVAHGRHQATQDIARSEHKARVRAQEKRSEREQ